MIWVIGLAAVILGAERTNLTRPAWIAIGAVALTTGIYIAPINMAIRNVALIVAAVDATLTMVQLLRQSFPETTDEVRDPATLAPERA